MEELEENNNERICAECGRIIEEDENTFEHDCEIYCEECFGENFTTCDDCEEIIHRDDITTTSQGFTLCSDCLEENYFFCESCEEWHHNDDAICVNDAYYCESCADEHFSHCEDCGEYFDHDREGLIDHDGRPICDSCADHYFYCEECGEHYHEDELVIDDDGNYICNSCYGSTQNERIYSYHEFRNWILYKTTDEEKPPFYIGFELETQPKDGDISHQPEALKCIYDNLNAICARDGSLGEGGFEIVSHPQSFKYILEHKEQLKNTLDALISYGYTSHDNNCCGLHFHITRPENPEVIDRLWLILETYKKEIILLSRRSGGQLSRWAQFLSDAMQDKKDDLKALYFIKKTNKNFDRYLALNNQNPKTIEFRFFKGTLKYNTFMASLEFINNLMTLCSNLELKIEEINWQKLCDGEFITPYIKERGINSTTIPQDTSIDILKRENATKTIINKIIRLYKQYARELLQAEKIKKTNLKTSAQLLNTAGELYRYYQELSNGFIGKLYHLEESAQGLDLADIIAKIEIIQCYYPVENTEIGEKVADLFEKLKNWELRGV